MLPLSVWSRQIVPCPNSVVGAGFPCSALFAVTGGTVAANQVALCVQNDEFWVQNDELWIQNDEFVVKVMGVCVSNDDLNMQNAAGEPRGDSRGCRGRAAAAY